MIMGLVLDKIDYNLLLLQKQSLVGVMDNREGHKLSNMQYDHLHGLLNLLDAITDDIRS